MTCNALASDMIAVIRDRIKPHCHGGTFMASEEVIALVKDLNTAHALAIEMEDEKNILERQLRLAAARPLERQAGHTGNIVAFPPPRPRLTIVPPPDGGDAA